MAAGWHPRIMVPVVVWLLASGCAYITRASVDSAGGDSTGVSVEASLDAAGRFVAFTSNADDVVEGDANDADDVFVRDLRSGETSRASIDVGGGDANGDSSGPELSADGRYVVFQSFASDLVEDDGNGHRDVFLRDLQTGTTTRVSVDDKDGDANAPSGNPYISADGRHISFSSRATDLVPGDDGLWEDTYVRDMQAGTTTRASVDATAGDPNSDSSAGPLSADGRYVTFASAANDLITGQIDCAFCSSNVWLRDMQAQTTTRVSIDGVDTAPDLKDPNQPSFDPSISDDGRYVAFDSSASDLLPGDDNDTSDVFLRDVVAGTTTRVSVEATDIDADDDVALGAGFSSISPDGRYVAFTSPSFDVVAGDHNGSRHVYVRDVVKGTTSRVSTNVLGFEANSSSGLDAPDISAEGRYVAFSSEATNLVAQDGTGGPNTFVTDVFVRAARTTTVDSVSPPTAARGTTVTLTLSGTGFFPGAIVYPHAFGPAGLRVNSVAVISETELEVSVTVTATAPTGARNVMAWNPGTGPGLLATGYGVCFDCLSVT